MPSPTLLLGRVQAPLRPRILAQRPIESFTRCGDDWSQCSCVQAMVITVFALFPLARGTVSSARPGANTARLHGGVIIVTLVIVVLVVFRFRQVVGLVSGLEEDPESQSLGWCFSSCPAMAPILSKSAWSSSVHAGQLIDCRSGVRRLPAGEPAG